MMMNDNFLYKKLLILIDSDLLEFLHRLSQGIERQIVGKYNLFIYSIQFLSRVSILLLTRDIDIAILSVCPSVCPFVCPSVTRDGIV